jgi:hypothetical protein
MLKPDCVSALQRKRLERAPEELRARLSLVRFESKNCGILGPGVAPFVFLGVVFVAALTRKLSKLIRSAGSPTEAHGKDVLLVSEAAHLVRAKQKSVLYP